MGGTDRCPLGFAGVLPVRKQVLEGILAADIAGFHTYDYARHFLSAPVALLARLQWGALTMSPVSRCTRVLGLECSPKGVDFKGRFCKVCVYPIGIDPSHFLRIIHRPSTQQRVEELSETFAGLKVLIGVDRLDYIKASCSVLPPCNPRQSAGM